VHLKAPIAITDELDEELIQSTGFLDLASGEIHDVSYIDYDVKAQGLPARADDYAFTSGKLSHEGKDVEFSIQVDVYSGKYSVTANELLDIKVRAAKLFAGIEGKDLAQGAGQGRGRKNAH
jgi:hypothetical protein